MRNRFLLTNYLILTAVDVIIINLTLSGVLDQYSELISRPLMLTLMANFFWLLTNFYFGLYRARFLVNDTQGYTVLFKALFFYTLLFTPGLYVTQGLEATLAVWYMFIPVISVGLLVNRALYFQSESLLKKIFKINKAVAVLGADKTTMRLAGYFLESERDFAFKGIMHNEHVSFLDNNGRLLPSIATQLEAAQKSGITDIYLSFTPERLNEFQILQNEIENRCLRLKLVADSSLNHPDPLQVSYMGGFSILSHRYEPLEKVENIVKKRVFDIIFSSLVIIFILSWLYPIIGLIIKIQSPGPILFKQLRSGKDNQSFYCYKFRSMKMNTTSDAKQATKDDDRITPIGRFLRKSSIDELPQFFNVLFGDMSIVGPRPHMLTMTDEYSKIINQYMVRHFLKAGITGWAQVNGFRGETKDPQLMQHRVEHDVWYLENWSMLLDIKIVLKTAKQMISGHENAY
ncbi:exopolysaccharide biosynthesis polyprenyl glycosylphosphotransferase [Mucilaginibacter sp. JRF]|uniref:exopolysaccharide biosynthesis polyprenyl glycosylphosphotransferase n=1 Tax=Mucilaginibacter sp. JRF TaxID=2780088 RepID=UPI00187EC49E|nr:exopolysaccharide biosynthesis polyprenyl glycosylphosphotransferase [Mucilaginibacter sp. JRF]MBE9585880.1 exopolysaccharide biosynthesis polyprenyl glycosylphosphotransferase [Mucilaginibacter sp. JRF]